MIQAKTFTVLLALVFLPACMSAQVDVLPPEENTPDTTTSTLPEFGVTIEDIDVSDDEMLIKTRFQDFNQENSAFDMEETPLTYTVNFNHSLKYGNTIHIPGEERRVSKLPANETTRVEFFELPWRSCGDSLSGSIEINPSGKKLVMSFIELQEDAWTRIGDYQMRIDLEDEYRIETRSSESGEIIRNQQVLLGAPVELPPLSFQDVETPNQRFVREGEVFTVRDVEVEVLDILDDSVEIEYRRGDGAKAYPVVSEGSQTTLEDITIGVKRITEIGREGDLGATLALPPLNVPESARLFVDEFGESPLASLILYYETETAGVPEAGLEGSDIPPNRQTFNTTLDCAENPTDAPARVLAEGGDQYSIEGTEFAVERVGRNVVLLSVDGERLLMQSDDIYKEEDVNVKVEEFRLQEDAAQLLFYDTSSYGAAQTDIKICQIGRPFSCPNDPSLDVDDGVLAFDLANVGRETVTLEELRVSSGRSSTTCSLEKSEYAPGETTTVRCAGMEDIVSLENDERYLFSLEADMYTTRIGPSYMRTLDGSIRI